MMAKPNYSIQAVARGEVLIYKDQDIELHLNHTYCDGKRLYCNDTSGLIGPGLPLSQRQEIFKNLCHYFNTKWWRYIFVLDERDKDRLELERFFAELAASGHKISVEYDSAEKREQVFDEMHLSFLRTGHKVIIDGIELNNAEDYWRWKQQRPS